MTGVIELGYLGLHVTDLTAWKHFACGALGLEWVESDQPDLAFLRMDLWHHRVALHSSNEGQPTDDLAYVGWRVSDGAELGALCKKLDMAGVVYRHATAAENAARKVLDSIRLDDPAGNPLEIFWGPQVDTHRPFHPGRPMFGRFVTGDAGLGHIVLRQHDVAQAQAFYELIGLRGGVQYRMQLPDGSTFAPHFMTCNNRQHCLGFGVGPLPKRVNHFMVEYTELDDLGLAHDMIGEANVAMKLGKHANDQALTFYTMNPSGWFSEIGWGGRRPTNHAEYYVKDIFGHQMNGDGLGIDM